MEGGRDFLTADRWHTAVEQEWDEQDWADFYHCIGFGLWKIAQRHKLQKNPPAIDFQI
jgi:hypothetical protein